MGKENPLSPCEAVHIPESAFGHLMWPIINKLFIWRETCFFDGSELKKQAAMPYCVSKELSLEIFFLHTKRETICNLFSTSEGRPPLPAPPFHVRIAVCTQACSELLSCLSEITPSLMSPYYTLNCCCWHVNAWSGSRSRVYSQCPVCTVKQWQMQTAVQSGRRGSEQTATCASIPLFSLLIMLKVPCALFLGRSWGNSVTGRHTLRSGDCGWHRFEISIATPVQAVSLQRPSWTTGLICRYYILPSYDLIWLNVWLREEDWSDLS